MGLFGKKNLFIGFCGVLFIIVGYFFWHLMNEKNTGKVRQGGKEQSSLDKNQDLRLYTGKYLKFSYKGIYQERAHSIDESSPLRESVFLTTSDYEGKKIAVTVASRGTNDLSQDPSFQMRSNKPEEYQKSLFSQLALPFSGVFFEKNTQPFEVTAFFSQKNSIVSISVISLFGIDGLKSELSDLIKSLELQGDY